jgi:hypothetical protein
MLQSRPLRSKKHWICLATKRFHPSTHDRKTGNQLLITGFFPKVVDTQQPRQNCLHKCPQPQRTQPSKKKQPFARSYNQNRRQQFQLASTTGLIVTSPPPFSFHFPWWPTDAKIVSGMCSIGFNSTSTSKVDYLIATWLPQFVLSSYTTCMGFSVAAAQSMVDEQALTLLDNIKVLTNQSRVESLCKVIRCPGGRKANVAPGDPGAANLGIQVSLKAEFNLMLTAYWLCHQDRVSRIPNPADVTLASVRSLADSGMPEWLCQA